MTLRYRCLAVASVCAIVACSACSKTEGGTNSDEDSVATSRADDKSDSKPDDAHALGPRDHTAEDDADELDCAPIPQRDEFLAAGDMASGLEACSDDSVNSLRSVACLQHFSRAECTCADGGVWFSEFYPSTTCADLCESLGGEILEQEVCGESTCEALTSECEVDADCGDGEACLCSAADTRQLYNGGARCFPSQCSSPEDCDGLECGVSLSRTGCGVMGVFCRTAQDECHGHDDCPPAQECVYQSDHWACSDRVVCDEP